MKLTITIQTTLEEFEQGHKPLVLEVEDQAEGIIQIIKTMLHNYPHKLN